MPTTTNYVRLIPGDTVVSIDGHRVSFLQIR